MRSHICYEQLSNFAEKSETFLNAHPSFKSDFDLLMRRVKTIESIEERKKEIYLTAIKAGNTLFDFFADIVIDDMDTNPCEHSIRMLKKYLTEIMNCGGLPHSGSMFVIWEDNILDGDNYEEC